MPRSKDSVTVSFTFDSKRHYVTGKTRDEAKAKAAIMKAKLQEGIVVVESNMPLKDWVAICYDKYKTNTKEETKEIDKIKANRWIVEPLGHLALCKIRQADIQGVINDMVGYSASYIKKILQLYKWVFRKALENRLINYDPTIGIVRPQGTKTERRAITEQEREHLLKVADVVLQLRFYLVMLFCGCRPVEVASLQGRDVVKNKRGIFLHIRGTKSKNADRYVPVPDYLYARLPKVGPWEYLFSTSSGRPLDEQARKRLWKRCKRELNISMGCRVYRNQLMAPYPLATDLTPYCLRHTYCTDLKRQGVDIRDAQYLMGHSDISLTANIYTHSDPFELAEVAEKLNPSKKNVYAFRDVI